MIPIYGEAAFIRNLQFNETEITAACLDIVRAMPNGRRSRAKQMYRCTTIVLDRRWKNQNILVPRKEITRREQRRTAQECEKE